MGFASLTVRARPSRCDPFDCVIALSASSSDIVTKPKPFERPVSRSVMMLTASTVPQCAKASLTSFSVVEKERFPTNNFFDNFIHLTCKETSGTFAVGINKQSITGQDQEAAEQLKFSDLIIADQYYTKTILSGEKTLTPEEILCCLGRRAADPGVYITVVDGAGPSHG